MTVFTDFMRSRLPGAVQLPDVLADLFDWIDGNGWVVRGADGEPYGGLSAEKGGSTTARASAFTSIPRKRGRSSRSCG